MVTAGEVTDFVTVDADTVVDVAVFVFVFLTQDLEAC